MWDAMVDLMLERLDGDVTARELIKNDIFANYLDPSGERHLRQMEEAGIDLTVLHPLDYGLAPGGEAPASIEEQNAAHAALVKKYPDKFLAFVGVDPRRANTLELIDRGVNEWGFKGLKLHPAAGFYPDDTAFDPMYQKACQLNLPVLIHTGHISPPLDSSYAHPAYIDSVAARYPQLTIIAAHMAFDWWEELAQVGRNRPNVCTDISGWQPMAAVDESSFLLALRGMLKSMGAGRILFGTDGLVFGRAMTAKDWLNFIKGLSKGAEGDIILDGRDVEAVMGLNAGELLSL
jgi:hypothetical protein